MIDEKKKIALQLVSPHQFPLEEISVSEVSIAILAAGRGLRMNGIKQSILFDGESLLGRAIRVAVESEIGKVNVILGYHAEQLSETIPNGVSFSINNNWEEGIASSIRVAVESATTCNAKALMFLACDQPFVDAALLRSLHDAFKQTQKSIVASFYGTPGIPAIFSKEKFAELLLLKGDKGAKQVILDGDAHLVNAPRAQYDIDTEADLKSCRQK
jgi:molybdenum cofactor cytidylyltransferase